MHKDDKWRKYERRNKGSQLRYIDTTTEYKPAKYSTPVQVTVTARVITYTKLPVGPIKSFDQLIAVQAIWIQNIFIFIRFSLDPKKYHSMDTTIDDVLAAHNKEGYLVAVSDGLAKNMHHMSFG